MAAGLGKRMKSDLPKVLHKLAGRPLVHHVIEQAKNIGSSRILLIIGHKRELVIEETQNMGVEWIVQEQQLGTGDAIKACESALTGYTGDVLILSGDVPLLRKSTIEQAWELHKRSNAAATDFTFIPDTAKGYGRIVRGEESELLRIVEEKDATTDELKINEVNAGIYFFKSESMYRALEEVKNDNAAGEYYLTDTISVLEKWGEPLAAFLVEDPLEVAGVNTIEQLSHLEEEFIARQGT